MSWRRRGDGGQQDSRRARGDNNGRQNARGSGAFMAIFVVDRTVSHADFISAMARSHFLRCEAKSDASFIIVSLRWLLVRWKLRSPMPVACRILSVGGSSVCVSGSSRGWCERGVLFRHTAKSNAHPFCWSPRSKRIRVSVRGRVRLAGYKARGMLGLFRKRIDCAEFLVCVSSSPGPVIRFHQRTQRIIASLLSPPSSWASVAASPAAVRRPQPPRRPRPFRAPR